MNILDSDGIPLIDQTSNIDDKVLLEIYLKQSTKKRQKDTTYAIM